MLRCGAVISSCFIFQIVRHDRTLEQIVFPIPEICELITVDTKIRVLNTTDRDDQGSKVSDFFERTEDMFNEMKWQKKLRGRLNQSRSVDCKLIIEINYTHKGDKLKHNFQDGLIRPIIHLNYHF